MTMTVTVNGDDHTFPDGTSMRAILAALEVGEEGIAVALDGEVHPRGAWDRPLFDGAEVEVLTAVQGG
ncbi:sulfur carrier protein ThiS [Gordonia jinhuaensis]|uniref:Thiamine biosynthesis protein ThiS n=1 Tax=Gordonia jinhuaensis TaxID=1517702 RepID=A0A916TG90_9ACTN|nr:sulfur carrier protein ThiS [Gordonia jinhuaensis]GGB41952.1 thiamine biosynthesis protein ThiS [Gordonia jinhuaensis]